MISARAYYLSLLFALLALGPAAPQRMNAQALSSLISSEEKLSAQEGIRESLALYTLLLDGDGVHSDGKAWVERIFTNDGIYQSFYPDGTLAVRLEGRDAIYQRYGSDPPRDGRMLRRSADTLSVVKHYMIDTVFDEITATGARTRTAALLLTSTVNTSGRACTQCGSVPTKMILVVYHDTWKKTDLGWQKQLSSIRRNS